MVPLQQQWYMDNVTWKDVFTPPFHNDKDCDIYVKDSQNRVTFNKCEKNPELYRQLLDKINGNSDQSFNSERKGSYIYLDGRRILIIRGWGRLTGIGMCGYKLDSRKACKIQDEFGDWIVKQLNSEPN